MTDNKLDIETIDVLKDALGDEFPSLINIFLADAPLRVGEMKALLQAGDAAGMERPAHTLKGSSGNIGAIALSAACAVLVDQIRLNTLENPDQCLANIQTELEIAKTMLEALLD